MKVTYSDSESDLQLLILKYELPILRLAAEVYKVIIVSTCNCEMIV